MSTAGQLRAAGIYVAPHIQNHEEVAPHEQTQPKSLMSEEPGPMGRIPKDHGHHSWASRDYEEIDCKAVGCRYNIAEKCAVPSRCQIGENGGCQGFDARPLPPKVDGD